MTGMLPRYADPAAQARAWCSGRDAIPVPALPLVTEPPPSRQAPAEAAVRPAKDLKRWQIITVTCLIVLIALGLAVYAAAASYESVSHLAAAKNVPLPNLNPAGIDGGLFGVIIIDIALTWAGHPLGWLRLMARVFAAGTIAANASAGWPDAVGVGLRVAAPTLFVVLTETARAVLLRRNQDQGYPQTEGIPLARWLIAPVQTFAMWRRMKLWLVRDYSEAVELDLSRRRAIVALTAHYRPGDWRKEAPADLVWMLRNSVRMPEALARVADLVAPPVVHEVAYRMAPASGPSMAPDDGPELAPRVAPSGGPGMAPTSGPSAPPEVAPVDGPSVDHQSAPPMAPEVPPATARRPGRRLAKDQDAERARAAYRKSVRQGEPLKDRALGEMFGRSRNWGAARIRECEGGPQLAARASG